MSVTPLGTVRRAGTVVVGPATTATTVVPYPADSASGDMLILSFDGGLASSSTAPPVVGDPDGPYPIRDGFAWSVSVSAGWTFIGNLTCLNIEGSSHKQVTWVRQRGAETSVSVTYGSAYQGGSGTHCQMHLMGWRGTDLALNNWSHAETVGVSPASTLIAPAQAPTSAAVVVAHLGAGNTASNPDGFLLTPDAVATGGFARFRRFIKVLPAGSPPPTMPTTTGIVRVWSSFYLIEPGAETSGGWSWTNAGSLTSSAVTGWR